MAQHPVANTLTAGNPVARAAPMVIDPTISDEPFFSTLAHPGEVVIQRGFAKDPANRQLMTELTAAMRRAGINPEMQVVGMDANIRDGQGRLVFDGEAGGGGPAGGGPGGGSGKGPSGAADPDAPAGTPGGPIGSEPGTPSAPSAGGGRRGLRSQKATTEGLASVGSTTVGQTNVGTAPPEPGGVIPDITDIIDRAVQNVPSLVDPSISTAFGPTASLASDIAAGFGLAAGNIEGLAGSVNPAAETGATTPGNIAATQGGPAFGGSPPGAGGKPALGREGGDRGGVFPGVQRSPTLRQLLAALTGTLTDRPVTDIPGIIGGPINNPFLGLV